ncbi:recombinase family protein [Bradyrhizobium sp.]|uniref:recombinase family protein n=1 Tax=Bradyrhizobium sp. TaxID=376 RepID=UPI001DDE599E|nr:recombinase family protein [Bradyrhizobium sp.]MBI5322735.1 recombinase family protein [Bradyrhizobium sp.]
MNAPVLTEAARAYSYVRFSTPQQEAGASLQRQTEKAAKYAADHGLVLDTEMDMTDRGVSAFRGKNARTGALRSFLDAVEHGYIPPGSYLLIENMDRMSRDGIIASQGLFSLLISSGINIVTLTDQELYTLDRFTREPEAMYRITAELIRANRESARKSQLIGDAKARKKKRLIEHGLEGKPYTTVTPAWIAWDPKAQKYTLIRERAKMVREMFERVDDGHGIDRIAQELNERGVNTWGREGGRKADHWRGSYIRKVLRSPAPIGTFIPHTTRYDDVTRARRDEAMDPIENMFPAAVDADLYWRVNRRLDTRAPRGRNVDRQQKSIVAGIMFCAGCGGAVTRISKGEYVYLLCSRANMRAGECEYQAVPYDTVEEALRTNARRLATKAPRGKSTAALEREIEKLQANANEAEQRTFDLADIEAREKSPAATQRRREMERQLREYQKELRALRAKRDTMTTASVKDRLKAVERVLASNKETVTETNKTLRDAIRRIVMDPVQGRLWVRWHHSEEPQDILCVTRHTTWEEGDITPPMQALFPEKN